MFSADMCNFKNSDQMLTIAWAPNVFVTENQAIQYCSDSCITIEDHLDGDIISDENDIHPTWAILADLNRPDDGR